MLVKPVAIGERPVAANKNLRIQNSGRRRDRTGPRRVASAGVYVRGDSYRRPLGSADPHTFWIERRFGTPQWVLG